MDSHDLERDHKKETDWSVWPAWPLFLCAVEYNFAQLLLSRFDSSSLWAQNTQESCSLSFHLRHSPRCAYMLSKQPAWPQGRTRSVGRSQNGPHLRGRAGVSNLRMAPRAAKLASAHRRFPLRRGIFYSITHAETQGPASPTAASPLLCIKKVSHLGE
jgi:hypothetical protein